MLFVFIRSEHLCLPVRNTCVYPRCLIEFILLYLLFCDVISIIVFVFLFFFFSSLCVSFEFQRLIIPLYLHNFIAKLTPPPNGKQSSPSNQNSFHSHNNTSDKTLPTYIIKGPSWSRSYSSWINN